MKNILPIMLKNVKRKKCNHYEYKKEQTFFATPRKKYFSKLFEFRVRGIMELHNCMFQFFCFFFSSSYIPYFWYLRQWVCCNAAECIWENENDFSSFLVVKTVINFPKYFSSMNVCRIEKKDVTNIKYTIALLLCDMTVVWNNV